MRGLISIFFFIPFLSLAQSNNPEAKSHYFSIVPSVGIGLGKNSIIVPNAVGPMINVELDYYFKNWFVGMETTPVFLRDKAYPEGLGGFVTNTPVLHRIVPLILHGGYHVSFLQQNEGRINLDVSAGAGGLYYSKPIVGSTGGFLSFRQITGYKNTTERCMGWGIKVYFQSERRFEPHFAFRRYFSETTMLSTIHFGGVWRLK